MRTSLTVILLTIALCCCEAQSFRIVSYNVENLFDTVNNPLTADDEFTPQGNRHWDSVRYRRKLQRIAEVIADVGEWQHAAIVGLVEIENDTVLNDLCNRSNLRTYGYRFIHHDSPDARGIDVALLYDPKQFQLLEERPIAIHFGYPTRATRDLLYAKGLIGSDTLHLIVCHTPSQLGGAEALRKRQIVLNQINQLADSLTQQNPSARIVLMGDFNDKPQHISPYIPALTNFMDTAANELLCFKNEARGTYVYQEQWTCLDQIFISQSLLNHATARIFNANWLMQDGKPHRTYNFIKYDRTGFSDHLPVYLDIKH